MQQRKIKAPTKLMLEVEEARRKMYEYKAAKKKAIETNPYIKLTEDKLVEKMLAPV